MEIEFLGTGAGLPSRQRNVSSLALKLLDELNEIWLFDCGEATQHQIIKTHIKPRKISRIFITHLHGDHIFGLPGFLSSRSFQMAETEPLTIYGPKGIKSFIESSLKYSKTNLLYEIDIVELDDQGGLIKLNQDWKVHYLPLEHGIKCFGYRIEEPSIPGRLKIDDLKPFNIPNGPLLGMLKKGERITLASGQVINGEDFLEPARKGRVITILGDTRMTKNIQPLAQEADILVHEATHGKNEESLAKKYYHSTSYQAAKNAKNNQVKLLLMNHISARYVGKDCYILQQEAQEIFKNSYIVNDFDIFEIKTP